MQKLRKSYQFKLVLNANNKFINNEFVFLHANIKNNIITNNIITNNELIPLSNKFDNKLHNININNNIQSNDIKNNVNFYSKIKNKYENFPNVGVIASKKVGKAVQRNRCKRLLRAAIRTVLKIIYNGFISNNNKFTNITNKHLATKIPIIENIMEKTLYNSLYKYNHLSLENFNNIMNEMGIVLIARKSLLKANYSNIEKQMLNYVQKIIMRKNKQFITS